MKLVVICDGISYPVEAICTSVGEANVLCGLNPTLSVMGEDGNGRYYLVGSAKPGAAKLAHDLWVNRPERSKLPMHLELPARHVTR